MILYDTLSKSDIALSIAISGFKTNFSVVSMSKDFSMKRFELSGVTVFGTPPSQIMRSNVNGDVFVVVDGAVA